MRLLLLSLILFIIPYHLKAQELVYNSGDQRVQLVELYTSEGCSSCPPADRWLSTLKNTDELWKTFVPMAFHVGYWDYIGWKDRFAKQEYTQRQRRYAAEFGETTVYTPGVRLAGNEWRSWHRVGLAIPASATQVTPGNLSLAIEQDGQFEAKFADSFESKFSSAQLTITILGQSLTTEVSRGENKGRTLKHDFVVLANTTVNGLNNNGDFVWQGKLPKPNIDSRDYVKDYAVAAWVSVGGSQIPIQALGGPLSKSLSPKQF